MEESLMNYASSYLHLHDFFQERHLKLNLKAWKWKLNEGSRNPINNSVLELNAYIHTYIHRYTIWQNWFRFPEIVPPIYARNEKL